MVLIKGDAFLMGCESTDAFSGDGEGPVRRVALAPFYISKYAVSTARFCEFVRATGYKTEAERYGWSFVFRNHVPLWKAEITMPGMSWWVRVDGADFAHPEGEGSSISTRLNHPASHISWNDARAWCDWAGYRLPTEAEWEYCARGGLEQKRYPWGDKLMPGGSHRCNIWQGTFPDRDLAEDGYAGTAPVDSFQPNGYGLFNTAGNIWEWCADWFDAKWHIEATRENPVGPPDGEGHTKRVIRGGSYLCHQSYCWRYRCAARTGSEPNTSTGHIGFRPVRDTA